MGREIIVLFSVLLGTAVFALVLWTAYILNPVGTMHFLGMKYCHSPCSDLFGTWYKGKATIEGKTYYKCCNTTICGNNFCEECEIVEEVCE